MSESYWQARAELLAARNEIAPADELVEADTTDEFVEVPKRVKTRTPTTPGLTGPTPKE